MVPPHAPGTVRLAVSLGDGVPRSRPLHFEYRVPLPPQPFDDNRCRTNVCVFALLENDSLEFFPLLHLDMDAALSRYGWP